MSEFCTDSPFAIILDFYERYRRGKLREDDLLKVVDKYAGKPQKMLSALAKKYELPVAKTVSIDRVRRLLALYPVPQAYADHIWSYINHKRVDIDNESVAGPLGPPYDAKLDINSREFDPSAALSVGRIITPKTDVAPLENISKFRIHAEDGMGVSSSPTAPPLDRTLIEKAKAIMAQLKPPHPLDTMALQASIVTSDRSKRGNSRASDASKPASAGTWNASSVADDTDVHTPHTTLSRLMSTRTPARIVVRRKGGVKGIMMGYVRAFDRHMNVMLSDVDELFVPNWKRVRMSVQPLPYCMHGTSVSSN
jgi:small nuclear ribonucleoprotein (snRNP)-like protein